MKWIIKYIFKLITKYYSSYIVIIYHKFVY